MIMQQCMLCGIITRRNERIHNKVEKEIKKASYPLTESKKWLLSAKYYKRRGNTDMREVYSIVAVKRNYNKDELYIYLKQWIRKSMNIISELSGT